MVRLYPKRDLIKSGVNEGPLVVSRGKQQGQPVSSPGAEGRVKAFLADNPDGRRRLPLPAGGKGGRKGNRRRLWM